MGDPGIPGIPLATRLLSSWLKFDHQSRLYNLPVGQSSCFPSKYMLWHMQTIYANTKHATYTHIDFKFQISNFSKHNFHAADGLSFGSAA
jgi:hypothetical protein